MKDTQVIIKTQPWTKNWPPANDETQAELTPEQMNLQRSYGTHASNTKGRIFAIDNKPKSKFLVLPSSKPYDVYSTK